MSYNYDQGDEKNLEINKEDRVRFLRSDPSKNIREILDFVRFTDKGVAYLELPVNQERQVVDTLRLMTFKSQGHANSMSKIVGINISKMRKSRSM